jgi:hypothetical protein
MTDKVAIFLDVENLSSWLKTGGGETLLERAGELGQVVVRRAYGDFSLQSVNARQTELNFLGFEFVHVYHPVRGKNSADIQVVVDAMEYLARVPDLNWFILATGDSDFSPLFRRLRELGKSVVGVGPRSALSEAVKTSCNRFIYIDERGKSSGSTTTTTSNQLREDALDLLERVLEKSSEPVGLSALKLEMLELDPSFDERTLGYKKFLLFLQSAPEVVKLQKNQQVWLAKAISTDNGNGEPQSNSDNKTDLQSGHCSHPTTDLYRRFLRKRGWRPSEAEFLGETLIRLKKHFPRGFTLSEEFEYLVESFGSTRTRGDIRAVIYTLYKAGFVVQYQKNQEGEDILRIQAPESTAIIAEQVDLLTLSRLTSACNSANIPFIPELTLPLLISSNTKETLHQFLTKEPSQATS